MISAGKFGYPKSHSAFNAEQYVNGPRGFIIWHLLIITARGFILEFFSDDRVDAKGSDRYFSCRFLPGSEISTTSTRLQRCSEVPGISVIDESTLYGSQNYQALNLQKVIESQYRYRFYLPDVMT